MRKALVATACGLALALGTAGCGDTAISQDKLVDRLVDRGLPQERAECVAGEMYPNLSDDEKKALNNDEPGGDVQRKALQKAGNAGIACFKKGAGPSPSGPNAPVPPPNLPEPTRPEAPNLPGESPNDPGGGGSAGQYPAEVRGNFLSSCTTQPNATATACRCALEKLEARVSFRDFKRADVATRIGGRVDPQVQTQISNAIADCS